MAFFKLRKAAGEHPASVQAPDGVEALRRRARYRLAGAALLVLAGVIGFPLLFDNQPRPIAVDIPIDIPDKSKVKPLAIGPAVETRPSEAAAEPVSTPPVAAPVATAKADLSPPKDLQNEEVIISASKNTVPAASKADNKPDAKVSDTAADQALAAYADKAGAGGRFIVQFGAFSDSAHAHEVRLKVEKAGLKTYAQIADTPDGKKFRVRVGPFEKRSDAEKAAEKIKKLDLPATILGL